MIDHHAYRHLAVSRQKWPEPHTLSFQNAVKISEQFFGSAAAIDHSTYAHKAEVAVFSQNRSTVINLLVLCDWQYPMVQSQVMSDRKGDFSIESKLLTAVTGKEISETELTGVGERVWNLMRAIAVREGRTRNEDTLHSSNFEPEEKLKNHTDGVIYSRPINLEKVKPGSPPKVVPRDAFEKAKDEYYHLRGWDHQTGWPTAEKLRGLGLHDIAQKLHDDGLLPPE
jgi:aldehyde:ferredoxin oxidoreductase